ncbi:hypothetical protein AVEN_228276-1 [Araneus ventricosus]|uniref:Uncharacterized protein n=1 Tax=Araneus ventricosus TaxID=182803 RepID=A0A4Y2E9R3_ARAVE|nr:hypothetical protein AVEN_228276-1 [Araneus ventricosus]
MSPISPQTAYSTESGLTRFRAPRGLRWPGGKTSISAPEGFRPKIRFYRRTAVQVGKVGPLHAKSVREKCPPVSEERKFGEGLPAQASSSSSDSGSKYTRSVPK